MVILSEITDKRCVTGSYPNQKQNCDSCNIAWPSQQQLSACVKFCMIVVTIIENLSVSQHPA